MAKETLKRLEPNIVEIKREVTNFETITVNEDVLNEDIRSAEAVVLQRESELASAESNLETLRALKTKIKNTK
jgi:hypothetical protein